MTSSRLVAIIFSLLILFLLGTLGWLSLRALEMEKASYLLKEKNQHESDIRLALWRMESELAAFLATESNRPWPPTSDNDYVKLYFTISEDGQDIDPILPSDVPLDSLRAACQNNPFKLTPSKSQAPTRQVVQSNKNDKESKDIIRKRRDNNPSEPETSRAWIGKEIQSQKVAAQEEIAQNEDVLLDKDIETSNLAQNRLDYLRRAEVTSRARSKFKKENSTREATSPKKPSALLEDNIVLEGANDDSHPSSLSNKIRETERLPELGAFRAKWFDDELILFRPTRATRSKGVIQALWIDRNVLEKNLLELASDQLPNATLKPQRNTVTLTEDEIDSAQFNGLFSLPYLLETPFHSTAIPLFTPWRFGLILAWATLALALILGLGFLKALHDLAERRAVFVSSVTHELRTPLTSFQLYSEMLKDGIVSSEDKRKQYLTHLTNESKRLSHLVENVLSYAGIECGSASIENNTIRIAELIERTKPILRERCDNENATLKLYIDNQISNKTLTTDPTAVSQIFFNLVDNACKYGLTEKYREVSFTISPEGNKHVRFTVSDSGSGIPRSERKKILRPFHKSATAAAHSKPGVGLGLAICKRQARLLGGKLSFNSPPIGASISLILPLCDNA